MKKITFLVLLLFILMNIQAQDYLISFSGTGASTSVTSVKVENLTQGTNLTLAGNQVLHLRGSITAISEVSINQINGISFYPNPMEDFAFMEFDVPVGCSSRIELFDLSGRTIIATQQVLQPGRQSFKISGLGSGVYIARVNASNFFYSGKLISNKIAGSYAEIAWQETRPQKIITNTLKNASSEIYMQYNEGDVLKFTATDGEHSRVLVYRITQNGNILFPFYKCVDKDNRNYATVKLGNQIWMAENLAYLPAVNPATVGSYTQPFYYVYGYEGTNVATAKATPNYTTYGVLYNWPAAKAACPQGWHLPTDGEWGDLIGYLGGYFAAGKMKETGITHWLSPNTGAKNWSGFSGLPGGWRNSDKNFNRMGFSGCWWSSTEYDTHYAWYRDLYYNDEMVGWDYNRSKDFGVSVRCVKNPTLTTAGASSTASNVARCGGNVIFDGGTTVSVRGVCWNTTGNPTTADNKTTDGSGTGSFASNLTGITSNTKYYIRAYATNSLETYYGNQVTFTTLNTNQGVTDIEENIYKIVKIGDQIWLAENLKTTKYQDGTAIPNVAVAATWEGLTTGAYCWYNNNETDNKKTYGALYNWYAINTGKLCPTGWHVPSDAEWI